MIDTLKKLKRETVIINLFFPLFCSPFTFLIDLIIQLPLINEKNEKQRTREILKEMK